MARTKKRVYKRGKRTRPKNSKFFCEGTYEQRKKCHAKGGRNIYTRQYGFRPCGDTHAKGVGKGVRVNGKCMRIKTVNKHIKEDYDRIRSVRPCKGGKDGFSFGRNGACYRYGTQKKFVFPFLDTASTDLEKGGFAERFEDRITSKLGKKNANRWSDMIYTKDPPMYLKNASSAEPGVNEDDHFLAWVKAKIMPLSK
jgi:hypothetical protein